MSRWRLCCAYPSLGLVYWDSQRGLERETGNVARQRSNRTSTHFRETSHRLGHICRIAGDPDLLMTGNSNLASGEP